jgi:hypothetical protein
MIGGIDDQVEFRQLLKHSGDRRGSKAQMLGEVCGGYLAIFLVQDVDGFDIVLYGGRKFSVEARTE